MIKKYKALLFDVDGTLIENKRDGFPTKRVTEAVNKASSLIHIGVASSRPLFMLSHIFEHLKLSGPSIINGGSQIVDIGTKKILWEKVIGKDDFYLVREILNKEKINFFVHDNDKDYNYNSSYILKKPLNFGVFELEEKLADYLIGKLTKIPNIAAHKVPAWVEKKVNIIVSHGLATKQHAILEVAKILNIETRDIIGVGDGDNDFPLLMACGLKVAMGNATKNLKEIADYIAPTVEEDGVAHIIEKFILKI